ncbi:MAG: 2'-deoxycytidine 5'-triphosphate deaminase [Geminicoccaceae bacterium]
MLASRQAVWVPPPIRQGNDRLRHVGRRVPGALCRIFDPGFGYHADGTRGTRAVLEVRAHEVPFIIDDNQIMGRIVYHDLIEPPYRLYGQDIGSNYAPSGPDASLLSGPRRVEGDIPLLATIRRGESRSHR